MNRLLLIIMFLFVQVLASSTLTLTDKEQEYIQSNPKIYIGSIDTYTPFSFKKHNKKIGFTQDLIDYISEQSGLKFMKVGGTWPEIFQKFKNNEIDIITEFSYRPERVGYTQYTNPYYEIPIGVFTRKDFGKYNGINSLKGKKIGIVKGSYLTDIVNKIDGIDVVPIDSNDLRFEYLSDGTVDVVLSNAMSIYRIRENLMLQNVKLSGYFDHKSVKKEDLRFGIRKEKPLLASIINKTLDSIPYSKMVEFHNKWIYTENNKLSALFTTQEIKWIENNKITVGIESAKPYIYYNDKNNDIDGLYSDIFKLVLKKTGLNTQYVQDSWDNLLADFKEKELDLLPATFYAKKREEFGYFSSPYYNVREYIFAKANNASINSFDDLKNKKVAIVKGYATIKKVEKLFPSIKIIETKNLAQSVSLLLNGKVDALIDYHLVVETYLNENGIYDIKSIAQDDFDAISVHYLSHIDKPILHSVLEKGLLAITFEEKNKLLKKWLRVPYEKNSDPLELTNEEKEFIAQHPVIKIRVAKNMPPFEFDQNKEPSGLAVDYVKKSAQNIGLNVEFVLSDINKTESYNIIETSQKPFDTLLYSVKNPQRSKRFEYGAAYLSYPMMIITHKDRPYVSSLNDLNGKTIVLEKDFLINQWIKKDFPLIKIVNASNTKQALQMVNDNKVFAYVGNSGIANYMSTYEGLINLKIAAPTKYGNIEYSFIAPKKWPELASVLSKGYKKITPLEHVSLQQKWFSLQTVEKQNYDLLWKLLIVTIVLFILFLIWNRVITNEKNKTKKALKELQKSQDELKIRNKELNKSTKQLEEKTQELFESQLLLQSVLDESPNPIVIKNYDGKFVLVNKAVATLYNTKTEDMIGKDDGDFIDNQKILDFMRENVKQIMDKGETQIVYEDSQDAQTGEIKHFMSIKKPFLNDKGEKFILVIANDITAIKALENEKLQQQQFIMNQSKIAAMGEMIGNIAHQWRQPLSVISTMSTGTKFKKEMELLSDEELTENMDIINNNAQYLSKTIDTFRNFIREEKVLKEVILQDRIKMALDIYGTMLKNNQIELETNIDDIEPIKMKLVLGELSQVIGNILNNAKDVIKEKEIKQGWIKLFVKQSSKNVLITIEDNAGGIEEEHISRIFEPYFTTKHSSQGTGLGLHMSYRIVTESLKGDLYVQNTDNGAKFYINLPIL